MTADRLTPPSSPPNFLDIYYKAQQIQYGDTPEVQPAIEDAEPTGDKQPVNPSRLFGELKKHPLRYGITGLAAAAVAAITLQPYLGIATAETPGVQTADTAMLVGDTSNQEEEPTGDPDKISFSTLLGERIEVGALLMGTVGGNGHIVFTRSDSSTGTVALPELTHQQSIEVYAQPIFSPDNKPISPITVTPKDDTYLIHVDRSKVGVVLDVAMPGTYAAATDASKKVATVTLTPTDAADAFKLSFLPTSSTPLSAQEPGMTPAEITRVNTLATASEQMAITEAKVISVKESLAYAKSATANECFANASEIQPADTTGLIRQKIDATFTHAAGEWASSNHRTLYIEMGGEYPLTNESAIQQYSAAAAVGNNASMKETARDIDTIVTNRYANYFGVSAVKMTCAPNEKLTSLG